MEIAGCTQLAIMHAMLSLFKQTRLWLLILCLIGNGLLPLGALANTRIWSPDMAICFSTPAGDEGQDSDMRHPLCCCHIGNDAIALPSPEFLYPSTSHATRAGLVADTHILPYLPFGRVRARGPPEQTFI